LRKGQIVTGAIRKASSKFPLKPSALPIGEFARVKVVGHAGCDLIAGPVN
jgi:hypothetical protein